MLQNKLLKHMTMSKNSALQAVLLKLLFIYTLLKQSLRFDWKENCTMWPWVEAANDAKDFDSTL